jgi:hypothetical protein
VKEKMRHGDEISTTGIHYMSVKQMNKKKTDHKASEKTE